MFKLGAAELRTSQGDPEKAKLIKRNPVYLILDNVMDTYNVGAIFRLADAVAVEKVFLCGQTETPPNTRIKKASINTTEWISWSYCKTAVEAIQELKNQSVSLRTNVKIIAVEQSEKSIPYDKFEYTFPIAFVVGHESEGVSQETLSVCDAVVEIPMWGVNKSLNVMVSLGIVLFEAMKRIK